MQTPALIVSLHDVSPKTRETSTRILKDLAAAGVKHVSLLVIPDHHHKAPIDKDPSFASWMQDLVAMGHEAVLHGFYHQRPQKSAESTRTRLITGVYTAGEGEFFDLSETQARELLVRGRKSLAACGLQPRGFIAPAWLLGSEALEAVKAENFSYTTYLDRILPLQGNRPPALSQSLVWSVRASWRRTMSLVWNKILLARLQSNPVIRIGIHPPDWNHPAIKNQVLDLTRRALAGRTPITYESWLSGVN